RVRQKTASGKTRTTTRTKSGTRTVSRKKPVKQEKKSSPIAVAGLVAVLAGVAWFGKDTLLELAGMKPQPAPVVNQQTGSDGNPSVNSGKKPASVSSSKVTLIGVDKRRQRAFVDGKEVD